MGIVEVLEISGWIAGGIGISLAGSGIIRGMHSYDACKLFYNNASDEAKNILLPPGMARIYSQSILDAPSEVYSHIRGRPFENAYMKYVRKLEKEKDRDYLRQTILQNSLRRLERKHSEVKNEKTRK